MGDREGREEGMGERTSIIHRARNRNERSSRERCEAKPRFTLYIPHLTPPFLSGREITYRMSLLIKQMQLAR